MKANISVATLAHVDAGKTTLSEALLFEAGILKKKGRVDHGDTLLDTDEMEIARGITIFARHAILETDELDMFLTDTPGHLDFAPETERIIDICDLALLVVAADSGVTGHTAKLFSILKKKKIPTIVFVNKMDLRKDEDEAEVKRAVTGRLNSKLKMNFVDFSDFRDSMDEVFLENISVCSETLMDAYLSSGEIPREDIINAVKNNDIYPVVYGSALHGNGVKELLSLLKSVGISLWEERYKGLEDKEVIQKVFKIERDDKNERLTFVKQLSGTTAVRDVFGEEKITSVRLYNGDRFITADKLLPGQTGAFTGLTKSRSETGGSVFVPAVSYALKFPDTYNIQQIYGMIKEIEEEEPTISADYHDSTKEITVSLMGEIGTDVLKESFRRRFSINVELVRGQVLHRETIKAPIEGVGHYEPLRHYAEVHVLLLPAERGEGVHVLYSKPENSSDETAYRAVASHLSEKQHIGCAYGFPLTDVNIKILAVKTHEKHTVGGDLREAALRSVRHALMRSLMLGEIILLEPYGRFEAEVPADFIGRFLTDINNMNGEVHQSDTDHFTGTAPMSGLWGYQSEILSYTRGLGHIDTLFDRYDISYCDTSELLPYDAAADIQNDPGSVFCSHGAGLYVPWYEVEEYMHIPYCYHGDEGKTDETDDDELERQRMILEEAARKNARMEMDYHSGTAFDEELVGIFEKTYGKIKKKNIYEEQGVYEYGEYDKKRTQKAEKPYEYKPKKKKPRRLIVDGYNIIFGWEELKELSKTNIDAARVRLCEIMDNYSGLFNGDIVVVFDAYRVPGGVQKRERFGNISLIYTEADQTADAFIEAMVKKDAKNMDITVASSDSLIQTMILGDGALRMSGRELFAEIERAGRDLKDFLK